MTESEKLAPESVTVLHVGKGALYGPRGFAPFETSDTRMINTGFTRVIKK